MQNKLMENQFDFELIQFSLTDKLKCAVVVELIETRMARFRFLLSERHFVSFAIRSSDVCKQE